MTNSHLEDRITKVVMTEWYYNPLKGQPRYVDITKLRSLAQNETVALRIQALIDVAMRKTIKIEGKAAIAFFSTVDFQSLLSPFLYDLLVLDAGVLVKGFSRFSLNSYRRLKSSGYELKPLGKRTLIELTAKDGGSFLKETDVNGVIHSYWQYSYSNPHVAPIQFGIDEIAYCSLHPRSYSCYGWSELQSADFTKRFFGLITRKPQIYKLTDQSVQILREAVMRTMNRDVMPEFEKDARFSW